MRHWEIAFTGNWPAGFVILAGLAAAVVAYLFYVGKRADLPVTAFRVLSALRIAGIVIIALFLLQPVLRISRTEATESTVAVLLDVSESMGIMDAAGDRSRLDAARALLTEKPQTLVKRLADLHAVRLLTFGAVTGELANAAELGALRPEQKATAIGESLREVARQAQAGNLAGIVLLTDGVSNRGVEPETVARRLGVPVFSVAVGGHVGERGRFHDVGIVRVPPRPQFIVNNKATLLVELAHRGLSRFTTAERQVRLRLLGDDDEELASATVDFPPEDGTLPTELSFVPRRVGVHRLRLLLASMPDETVTENNARAFTALVTDPRIRVLIVEGVVRSEYRFLRRVLESDPNLEVTSVIKLTRNRFLVQGVQTGVDLSRGLPAAQEDYGEFDLVLLGDIGRDEFTGVQLEYLKDFVDGGGALLAVGGYNAFGAGGYADSPLADILPVTMGGEQDGHVEKPFVPALTGEGRAHPVFAGCEGFFSGPDGQASLDGANRVTGVKPGAQVLAVHPLERTATGPMPVVAVQSYGEGRTMAMTADTTWKWKFQVEAQGADSPYYRFWRQSIRWLAGRTEQEPALDQTVTAWPARIEYEPGEAVVLKARVLSQEKEPEEHADVQVTVRYPIPVKKRGSDGELVVENDASVRLDPVPLSPGDYQATWLPPAAGLYQATASAGNETGELGTYDLEFVVGQAASEFDRVDVDETVLRSLAAQTGGAFYTLATAGQIPDELQQRRSVVVVRRELNLWNAPGFFTAFLLCVTAEWIYRKRRGLN